MCSESKTTTIIAHSFTFKTYDNPETDRTTLEIWAMGRNSDRYFLRQDAYPVSAYVKFPKVANRANWDRNSAFVIYEHLQNVLYDDKPINYQFYKKKEL